MKSSNMVARAVALASVAMALTVGAGALAQTADAIGPDAAERAALRALGASGQESPRSIVFSSSRMLPAGDPVRIALLRGDPDASGTATAPMPVALRAPQGEPAWLFYEDRAPNTLFEHGGRVVLVGASSGATRVSSVVPGPPVVGGQAPRFIQGADGAYMSFQALRDPKPAGPPSPSPALPPAPTPSSSRAAQQLAAQRTCFVRAADTLGAFAPGAAAGRSGAAFARLAGRLGALTPGIVSSSYRADSGITPSGYVQGLVDANGCREVSLYLAGGGYQAGGETAIAVGARVAGDRIKTQLVTATDLRALLRSRPSVWWNLTLDAPHSGALLEELSGEPNLASAQASGRSGDPSFIASKPAATGKRMLKFTRGLLGGLRAAIADEGAVVAAIADRDSKRAPSFLSALLSRGLDRGISPRAFAALGVQPQSFLRAATSGGPGGPGAPGGSIPGIPIDGGGLPPAPVNKPPAIVAGSVVLGYAENDPAAVIDPSLTVSDLDSAQLTGATVTVASGYVNGADELGFVDDAGISGAWNATTGVLTLSGGASVATYQDALRTVTYRNASDDPVAGPRSIAFRVDDGKDESADATQTVEVTVANDAPEAQLAAGSVSYTENDAPTPIDAALTVVDPDSANLASATVAITVGLDAAEDRLELTTPVTGIVASYDEPSGVLTLTGPASKAGFQAALRAVAYSNISDDPDTGTRTVAVSLTDSDSATGPSRSRSVTIAAVNNSPQIEVAATALAYAENDPATAVDPALTVSDSDSAQLTGATVTVTSGYVNGADELGFTGGGAIGGGWNAADGVLTLTGSASVAEYQAALRTVTYANSSNDPVVGPRSLAFRVDDGTTESSAATRTIEVTASNDAPDLQLPASGSLAYVENDPATAIDPGATLSDPDSANFASATAAITAGLKSTEDRLELMTPVAGIVASYDEPTGVLTLTGPASVADFQSALRAVGYRDLSDNPDTGTRTVTLAAKDSDGASTPGRSRNVVIGAVDNAPTVSTSGSPLAYAENDPATVLDPALTVSDPDSPNLVKATVQLSSGYTQGEDQLAFPGAAGISGNWETASGTLTLTGSASPAAYQAALRSVTYANTSDNPLAGPRTVSIQVEDGTGASNVATRSIEVSISNDAPAVQLASGSASYTENAAPTPIDAALTVVDPDSANLASATVAITAGLKSAEDRLELTTPVAGIVASYDEPTGVLTLTGPASVADFQAALRAVGYRNLSEKPDTATRTVAVTLTDSAGATGTPSTRNVNVAAVNDTPVAVDDNAGSTDEATVLNAAAPGVLDNDTDPEGDTLTVAAVNAQPAKVGVATLTGKGASVTVNANGSFSYDPSGSATLRALGEGETTTDTFSYTAKDGSLSSTATVTVTVIGLPDPPVANNDSYSGVGNTTLTVGQSGPSGEAFKQVSGSVLDNDTDADTPANGLSVSAKTSATTLGGSATIAADGKFTYTPPVGTTGTTDSFDYTVSDSKQTDTGTVQIALSGRVWYVDNDRAAAGSGRSSSPFDSLAAAASASSAGDTIYVHQGDGTSAKQNAGVTLKANQQLLGEAVDLVVGADTLFDGAPGQRPTIGNSAGAGITLASGSRVEGLKVSAAGGKAISGGAGVAGSTIADVIATGSAGGVGLSGTSGTFAVSDLAMTTSGGTGFTATNAGTVQFASAGTISIAATGGPALDASGSALSGTIDTLSVPSSSAGGVGLLNTTGSLAFGDISITTSGGTGFLANNAAGLSVPAAGTDSVSSTGGPAVDIRSLSSPAVAFDNVSSTNSSGTGFNVDTVSGGSVTASGGTIAGAAGAAVDVNAGNGTVGYGGAITDGSGRPAEVTGRTAGAVTLSGNITEDDTGISVSGNTGGSTEFSGASKSISTGAGNAVSLSSNSGHTVSFSGGGLALTTTSGKGFVASGGGTVNVTGTANTIASTTGTALDVQSTTIGASDLVFRSIAANGGANGIVLNTTGSSGGLTVTGNGSADSGGVIQNTVGSDGTTAGVGAYLNSTSDVSLSRMRFTTNQGHAIRGTGISGFALTDSTVNGTNGTNDGFDEGSVSLTGLTGTASIVDTTIQGGYEDNLDIYPNSGALTLALTRLTVGANSTALGGNGVLIVASGSANVTTTVSESDFTSSREDLFQHVVQGQAKSNFTFSDNELSNNHPAKLSGSSGIIVQSGGNENAELTYRIANNKIREINGPAIFVQKAVGISKAQGRIVNNQVGLTGVAGSGAIAGIGVEARGQGSHTTTISGNVLRRYSQGGIEAIAGEDGSADNGTVSFDVNVTNNTVTEPEGTKVSAGFRGEVADPLSKVTFCLDLKENALAGSANFGTDIRVFNDWPANVFRLPGYAGGAFDQTAVMNYFAGRNTLTTKFASVPESGNGYSNTAACAQPPA